MRNLKIDDGLNRIKEIFKKEFTEPFKTKNVSRKIMKIRQMGGSQDWKKGSVFKTYLELSV